MSRRPTRSSRGSRKALPKSKRKGRHQIRKPRHKSRPKSPAQPALPTVIATGALCWRPRPGSAPGAELGPDDLEVLLVLSARWGEWSWPKGKLEPGESLPECAVREVAEETGVSIRLGRPLPSVEYVLPDGRDKTVHYWAATVQELGIATAEAEEIAEVAWLPVAEARERLSRPGDLPPLEALLQQARAGELDTRALVVLRHAKARSRANWPGTESDRPLTSVGRTQANALPGLLAVWAPDHVLSSPWARCMQTLRPYLRQRNGLENAYSGLEILPLLSEQGLRNDPDRVPELLTAILEAIGSGSWLVCTHRPVLETVMATLAKACAPEVLPSVPAANPYLGTGEALVAHVTPGGKIVALERFRGQT